MKKFYSFVGRDYKRLKGKQRNFKQNEIENYKI